MVSVKQKKKKKKIISVKLSEEFCNENLNKKNFSKCIHRKYIDVYQQKAPKKIINTHPHTYIHTCIAT